MSRPPQGDRPAPVPGTGGAAASQDEPDRDSLAADYTGAGFGRSLPWGTRPALLMVDLIRAYFQPGAEFFMGSDSCLRSAARVLASARAAGIPVLHTRVEYDPDGTSGGLERPGFLGG